MFVMTIDQRGSTGDRDRVPDFIAALARLGPTGFERSVGDEVQGVVPDAANVVDIALFALRTGHWYVGIGVGTVELDAGASPREGAGTGFVAARKAVEQAKAAGSQVPLSVVPGTMGREARNRADKDGGAGMGTRECANAEAVLRLLGRIVQERTEAQWRVVDALHRHGPGRHGTQKQVAAELGITEQSVSRTVLRSGCQEEWAARPAAEMLLDFARLRVGGNPAGTGASGEGS